MDDPNERSPGLAIDMKERNHGPYPILDNGETDMSYDTPEAVLKLGPTISGKAGYCCPRPR